MILAASSASMSAPDLCSSDASTSAVCWPRSGGGWRYWTGVPDRRMGLATMPTVVPPGCGMSTRMPRWTTCGCSKTCA